MNDNQKTNESPQTIQENLAVDMAEFCGWQRNVEHKIDEMLCVWDVPCEMGAYKCTNHGLVRIFFDPCPACRGDGCEKCKDHKSNPRGFLMVWNKLWELYPDYEIEWYQALYPTIHTCCHIENTSGEEYIDWDGTGPTKFHAFYSAVNELMPEVESE